MVDKNPKKDKKDKNEEQKVNLENCEVQNISGIISVSNGGEDSDQKLQKKIEDAEQDSEEKIIAEESEYDRKFEELWQQKLKGEINDVVFRSKSKILKEENLKRIRQIEKELSETIAELRRVHQQQQSLFK